MARNGFTLVELMVVIALMALAAGAVVATLGSPGGGPTHAATRFASRLAATRDEAIVSGRPMNAWISASGYGFEQFRQGRWHPVSAKPFQAENWPDGISVNMSEDEQGRARARFDNLGMVDSAMTIQLVGGGQTAIVKVAANGDVAVE